MYVGGLCPCGSTMTLLVTFPSAKTHKLIPPMLSLFFQSVFFRNVFLKAFLSVFRALSLRRHCDTVGDIPHFLPPNTCKLFLPIQNVFSKVHFSQIHFSKVYFSKVHFSQIHFLSVFRAPFLWRHYNTAGDIPHFLGKSSFQKTSWKYQVL